MEFKKEDKWLLASNLQKSIRRGIVDEAKWSAWHLYDVDRAYLSYRLSVIAVEDIGAGEPGIGKWIDGERKWGARRFDNKKSEEDKNNWIEVVEDFSKSIKDRTPCNWMGCTHFMDEFLKSEGDWENLDPVKCIDKAYDDTMPWWWRGLMAWRAAGTDRFPNAYLGEVGGAWDRWVDRCEHENIKILLKGFGERQREAHPIFLPLAYHDRINDKDSEVKYNKLKQPIKIGPWLSPAIDSHTAEGKRAISVFLKNHPLKNEIAINGWNEALAIISKVMFWAEGGVVNDSYNYKTSKTIDMDMKNMWFKKNKLSGRWVSQNILQPDEWNKAKNSVINLQDGYHKNKANIFK